MNKLLFNSCLNLHYDEEIPLTNLWFSLQKYVEDIENCFKNSLLWKIKYKVLCTKEVRYWVPWGLKLASYIFHRLPSERGNCGHALLFLEFVWTLSSIQQAKVMNLKQPSQPFSAWSKQPCLLVWGGSTSIWQCISGSQKCLSYVFLSQELNFFCARHLGVESHFFILQLNIHWQHHFIYSL